MEFNFFENYHDYILITFSKKIDESFASLSLVTGARLSFFPGFRFRSDVSFRTLYFL